jgi:hypothetical protein
MLDPVIGLVVLCLLLPWTLYVLTHTERMLKKEAQRHKGKWWAIFSYSENNPHSVYDLRHCRILTGTMSLLLICAVIVYAYRLWMGPLILNRLQIARSKKRQALRRSACFEDMARIN